jgi:hypothetical protein
LGLAQAFFTVEYKHFSRSIKRSEMTPNTDFMMTSISSLTSLGNIDGVKVDMLKKKKEKILNDV